MWAGRQIDHHATLPGGLLVLAVVAWALVIGVAFGYTLFAGDPPAQSVPGSWFIPPVVTIIIPMVLAPLIAHTDPTTARLLPAGRSSHPPR